MKIEEGKFYKTRDGRKVGPMMERSGIQMFSAPQSGSFGFGNFSWGYDGFANYSKAKSPDDLIAEWEGEPKTWGELSDEEKGALLLAHHEEKIIEYYSSGSGEWMEVSWPRQVWYSEDIYRVRPEPKRETVTLEGPFFEGYAITVETVGGKFDCESIKMVELE